MKTGSARCHAKLPIELWPRKTASLVRIGKDNDGGYLVDGRNLEHADALVGLGINDDWSFEQHFLERRKIPLYAFDATVSKRVFFKKFLKTAIFRFYTPATALHWLKVATSYNRFFRDEKRHFQKMIGMEEAPNYISVTTIFEKFLPAEAKRIFFKIDIEGSEYRILDELVKFADRIEGLVIEFHDVDLHLEKIKKFIAVFPLQLCHTHCNNYGPLDKNDTPLAIELTFTSRPLATEFFEDFPAQLDMPNCKSKPDYSITFS